jgi:hypothetical protein
MKKLKNWIEPKLTSGAQLRFDRMPDVGRVILLQPRSGPGLSLEGLYDNVGFAMNCRGAENNYEDAENIALDFDDVLLRHGNNVQMDDVHVQFIGRIGGGPTMITIDDPQSRFTWTCSYYAIASTGL